MTKNTRSSFAALVMMAALFLTACGGDHSLVGPSPTPTPTPTPTIVYAPPPAGVSAEMWRIGFSTADAKLRGLPEAVHFVLPEGTDQATRDLITGYNNEMNSWGLKTHYDLDVSAIGATIPISIEPGLICGSWGSAGGCMSAIYDNTGRLTGGWIKFDSVGVMKQRAAFFHEAFRCLGVEGLSPEPGVMSSRPLGSPTDKELALLLGREKYPLLSVYSPQ